MLPFKNEHMQTLEILERITIYSQANDEVRGPTRYCISIIAFFTYPIKVRKLISIMENRPFDEMGGSSCITDLNRIRIPQQSNRW